MKKRIRLIISLVLCVIVFMQGIPVFAKTHEHNWTSTCDVCTKCGALRKHEMGYTIQFVTVQSNVYVRTEPRNSGKIVRTYGKNKTIKVKGRLRNEKGNLWLITDEGYYVYADRVALNFDALIDQAYKDANTYVTMLNCFREGGKYDLKRTNKLGLNTYDYQLYVCGKVVSERYTGETLGNVLYGAVASKNNISPIITLTAPCVADLGCTDPKDNRHIMHGYAYAKTGKYVSFNNSIKVNGKTY